MAKTIVELTDELEQVKSKVEFTLEVLERIGVTIWLTPNEAVPYVGVSAKRILEEIRRAEELRVSKKKSDLVYGTHYFNSQNATDLNGVKPSWKVHYKLFGEVIRKPLEERIV